MSKIVYSPDKPNDCRYCHFWKTIKRAAVWAKKIVTTYEAICSLTRIVGESNTALCKQCEHAINSLYAVQLHLVKLAYLRGAEDREKMLR